MEEDLKLRHLKIYCPTHQTTFEIAESPKIVCEIREHALSNNFPHEEFWEYCCDCQTFFPSQLAVGGKAKATCLQCERPTIRRFVCNFCKVVSFDSGEDTKGKQFSLDSKTFAVSPSCPGCLTNFAEENLHLHKCGDIEAVLTTPRETCPFCKKEIVKPSPKPVSVSRCSKCQAENKANNFFCDNCGNQLSSNPNINKRGTSIAKTQLLGSICPTCGAGNNPDSVFCPSCGQALKVQQSKPIPLPPPIPPSFNTTQSSGAGMGGNAKSSTVKSGNGKGCLIGVGVLIGAIFLCVIIQAVVSNKNAPSSSLTATPSPKSSNSPPSFTPAANSSSNGTLPNSFENDYQGTIGGRSFSMSLKRNGTDLRGTASTNKTDYVYGTIDTDGTFSVKGYENDNKLTGNYSGRIYSDGSIRGSWTNLQGGQGTSFSLSLSE